MKRTTIYIILTMLALSVTIGIENVKAEGLWTGCIDSYRGDFYDFQLGLNPLSSCRTNDYTEGFYNKTYVDNLQSQINVLTNIVNSLTVFSSQKDVTNERLFNNVYQNNLSKSIFVAVSANCGVPAEGTCVIQGLVGTTNPISGYNNTVESGAYHTPSAIGLMPSISFVVPPGSYYDVTTSLGGSPTLYLDHWTEWS